jgi:uncharacterized protein YyaL (SSP411 family)
MAYVQAATGSGGWPMTVILTPSLKPIYGGTYFPPDDRGGRPGLKTLLRRIAEAWRADAGRLETAGQEAMDQLQAAVGRVQGGIPTGEKAPEAAFEQIRASYDPVHGGFGGAPKFPRPATLHFLLRHAVLTGNREALAMAVHTLRRMADGGIHDRIGGGFHRYAVDERWRLPHFEKMLYDQAQLALVYLDAFLATRDPALGSVARDTLNYVRRDMTGPEGQFYSAEDADSLEFKDSENLEEGAFYVWEAAEIKAVLGEHAGPVFSRYYGVKRDGNLGSPGGAGMSGKNMLHVTESLDDLGKAFSITPEEARRMLEQGRQRLFQARAERPRPRLDDKALAAWNGLMVSAFARAHQVYGDADYLDSAERAMRFIRHRLEREPARLWRRFRAGEAAIDASCLDYACVIQGALDLYEASFDHRLLEWAVRLQDRQIELFGDEPAGGFFDAGNDSRLLLRLKESYDGAEPSANSISALNLLRLHHAASEKGYEARVDALFAAFGQTLRDAPDSAPQLMAALALRQRGLSQVVIAGRQHAPDVTNLLKALRHAFRPDVMVFLAEGGASQAELAGRMPFLRDMVPLEGKAAAYVCRNFTCQKPVTDASSMIEQLVNPR